MSYCSIGSGGAGEEDDVGDGGWGADSKGPGPRTVSALGENRGLLLERRVGQTQAGRIFLSCRAGKAGRAGRAGMTHSLTCLHFLSPASRKALRSSSLKLQVPQLAETEGTVSRLEPGLGEAGTAWQVLGPLIRRDGEG